MAEHNESFGKVVWPLEGDWGITFDDALMTLTGLSDSKLEISLYNNEGSLSETDRARSYRLG